MNRLIIVALITCATCAFATPAWSQREYFSVPLPDPKTLRTCSDWQKVRSNKGFWQGDVYWVHGFVSGHNYYTPSTTGKAVVADANEIALWLDTYCQKNPTHAISAAAVALVETKGGAKARQP